MNAVKREQAVALVKELVANHLILATWLSVDKRETGGYELHFKGDYDRSMLDEFLLKHNLAREENEEKGFLVIFKP